MVNFGRDARDYDSQRVCRSTDLSYRRSIPEPVTNADIAGLSEDVSSEALAKGEVPGVSNDGTKAENTAIGRRVYNCCSAADFGAASCSRASAAAKSSIRVGLLR